MVNRSRWRLPGLLPAPVPPPSPPPDSGPSDLEQPSEEPRGLGAGPVDAHASLPQATAQLTVQRARLDGAGEPVFELVGFCCCGEDLPPTRNGRHGRPPRIALGTLISGESGGESPTRSLNRMRSWSRSKYELLGWIRRIRDRHGDDLRLIIWDDSGFEIPWELLWVDQAGSGGPGAWLGALAVVTRWTTVHAPGGPLPYASADRRGSVAGYVADEMSRDRDLLAAHRLSPTLWELISHLETSGPGPALVYIACHGEYGSTGFDFTLGDLAVGEVDWRTFPRVADGGGLVFVNACHSGRLIDDPEYNDATTRGFAEVFLRSGAAGFLGTAGAVLEDEAHRVAAHLLAGMGEPSGLGVATALRDYRRTIAVTDLPPVADRPRSKELLPFVSAFMYLYFGGPDTTIALYGGGG
ncbi:CHAT domain-containing protein [Actinomadura napierensis]|uniref:CHAT domain-containing protein n=1 Tax=Actinomadura napierensis TaxID=267854 RepID=UPI0031D1E70F